MILGLDLSLTATGWCKLYNNTDGPDSHGYYRTGVISIPGANEAHISQRLRIWAAELRILMMGEAIDHIYIEDIGGTQHGAVPLGMIHAMFWRAITSEYDHGIVTSVNAKTLKMHATGNGNAKKAQVLAEAVRRLGYEGHDDNEADALWLADLGARIHGWDRPDLPATHLRALDKIKKAA